MFCKNCGAQLDGTENVCPTCGTPVEKDTPVVEQPVVSDVQPVQAEPVVTDVQPEAVAAAVEQPVIESAEPVMESVEPVVTEVQPVTPEITPVTPEVQPEVPTMPEATPVSPEAVAAVAPEPTLQSMPEAPAPVVPAVAEPTMPAEPVVPAQPGIAPAQPAPVATAPAKKNTTTIILIAVLGALFVIAIIVVLFLFVLKPQSSTPTPTGGDNPTEISTGNENRESYGGYSFEVPDGYQTKVSADYGLMFYNSDIAMSVMVDYSHSYSDYKAAVQQKYPDQYASAIATVDGREYIALILTDTDGKKSTTYMTKADNDVTFIGMVANSNYTAPTKVEFSVLTGILDSAKTGSSSFAAGDDNDAGKDGIKDFTFDKDKFTFAK